MSMSLKETLIKYTNIMDRLVNKLAACGHFSEPEKSRALLNGLIANFALTKQVLKSAKHIYTKELSKMIIHESNR